MRPFDSTFRLKRTEKGSLTEYHLALSSLIFTSIFFFGSCTQNVKTITKAEMKAIVENQNFILESYFKEGNANKLAELYTDSAKLSPNGSGFIISRNSIKTFWIEELKQSKVKKMETHVLTIDGNDNIIYETGVTTSEIIYKDSVYYPRVKYINVWKKQPDGKYKLDVDFWNKDTE